MKPTVAPFPATRLRRMRKSPAMRALARQNTLTTDDLIWPVFVMDGKDDETPVASMPGVVRRTVDRIADAAKEAQSLGIPAICIFPYTGMEARTEDCAMAWDPDNLTNQAIRAIKDAAPDIAVMTDIALRRPEVRSERTVTRRIVEHHRNHRNAVKGGVWCWM